MSDHRQAELAEKFLASSVGRYLVAKADEEHTAVIHDLMSVDPTDLKAVCDLRVRASVSQTCVNWLMQTIRDAEMDDDIDGLESELREG